LKNWMQKQKKIHGYWKKNTPKKKREKGKGERKVNEIPKCPKCGCEDFKTIGKVTIGNSTVATQECVKCGHRYGWEYKDVKKVPAEHRFNIKINLDFLSPIKSWLGIGDKND